MLLRPVVVHFAVVTLLLPVAAVYAILDRVENKMGTNIHK